MIAACVLFLLAIFALVLSIRSFCEKGFLLNNAYLYASKQEREKMNKKPHYRQSAIVFLLLGLLFLLIALAALFKANWIFYVGSAVVIITLLYAIVSSITIERNHKQ